MPGYGSGRYRFVHRFNIGYAGLLFLLVSLSAHSFVLWSDALPPLTPDDIAAIGRTTEGLELQEPGTTWRWDNPKTGHSGAVTLVKAFQAQGMHCRVLRHFVSAGTDEPWVTEFTTCMDPDGSWVLRPDVAVPGPKTGDAYE